MAGMPGPHRSDSESGERTGRGPNGTPNKEITMLQKDTGNIRKARRVKRTLIAAATAVPLSLAGIAGAQAANDVIIGAQKY